MKRDEQQPYGQKGFKADLLSVREKYRSTANRRQRDAIYEYLTAAYGLFRKLRRLEKRGSVDFERLMLKLNNSWYPPGMMDNMLRFIINWTIAPDRREFDTSLSRVAYKYWVALSYAHARRIKRDELKEFVLSNGGLNGCATKFRKLRET